MSEPVSTRKREANRRNAQHSTGPKTCDTTRFNAMKHGLLSQNVVIEHGAGREAVDDFQQLLAGLRDHYQPVGIWENMLVDKIAGNLWRLARANRAERGEIEAGVLTEQAEDQEKKGRLLEKLVWHARGLERVNQTEPPDNQGRDLEEEGRDLKNSTDGLTWCLGVVADIRQRVESAPPARR